MRKLAIYLMPLLLLALVIGAVGCGGGAPSATPTVTATPAPTASPAITPTVTPAPTPTASPTITPAATPTPTPTAEYLTYTDGVSGFSVAYPEDWETKALPAVLFAVESLEQCRGHGTTFYLQKMELADTTDIESFFGPTLSHTFSSQERSFIYGEKMGVSGKPAIKWVSAIVTREGLPLKEMSVYVLDGRTAWILSFTTSSYCWNQYEEIFEHMLGSFQLIP